MTLSRRIDLAAVMLRTGVGLMFLAHAAQKYFAFTLPGTARFFESLGLPGPLAVHITLQESGLPFSTERIDRRNHVVDGGDYDAINPKGYVSLLPHVRKTLDAERLDKHAA